MDPAFAEYVAAHRAQLEHERAELPLLVERARTAALEAARRIAAAVNVERIYLFGSLARGTFHRGSDIDLAIDGMTPGSLIDALTAAEQDCPFRVDVIPLDAARPDIARAIRTEAVIVWP